MRIDNQDPMTKKVVPAVGRGTWPTRRRAIVDPHVPAGHQIAWSLLTDRDNKRVLAAREATLGVKGTASRAARTPPGRFIWLG